MESLQKQEIIKTPEAKGMRTQISEKPAVITANALATNIDTAG